MKTTKTLKLVTLSLLISLSACKNPLTGTDKSKIDDGFDNSPDLELPSVTFEIDLPLPLMNSINAPAYTITGTCDSEGSAVVSLIGGPDVTETVACGPDGRFSATLDVTGITSNPPNISISQGDSVLTLDLADLPLNDQTAIANAPTAVAPGSVIGGPAGSYALDISCTEVGEVVTISGSGLTPASQDYTCTSVGSNNMNLALTTGVETTPSNSLTISSVDVNGNLTTNDSSVVVDIDTLGPRVTVVAGADVIQSQSGTVTIALADPNLGVVSFNAAGAIGADAAVIACTTNPCAGSMSSGANTGSMTFTVAAGLVADALGNTNVSAASDSLTVNPAGALALNEPLPILNTQNMNSYPVSGSCDDGLGLVTVNVGTPVTSQTFFCNAPGVFSGNITLSSVVSNPAVFEVTQGVNSSTPVANPVKDTDPIINPPNIANQPPVNGTSVTIAIPCTEIGEVVSFGGVVLNPSTQTHTCSSTGSENVTLGLTAGQETPGALPIFVNSTDVNGNPTVGTDSFTMAVDNIAPVVAVAAGSDVIVGNNATFTVTVTEGNTFLAFTPTVSSGTVSSGACSASPCTVAVTDASEGTLTMTVAVGGVADAVGNTNAVATSDALSILASTLSVNNPPLATQANAAAYPVSGSCDDGAGNVTVTIGTPNATSSVACSGGTYSTTVDVSSVTSDPMAVSSEQNGNTANPAVLPENDQTPITTAPTVAGQSVTNGSSTMVSVTCNEVGEVVSFANASLNPNPQAYTCVGVNPVGVTLNFATGQETANPNNVTVSSVDVNGNVTTNSTTFNLPIDNVAPVVSLTTNGGDIDEGTDATFTVTIVEGADFTSFTPNVSSGSVTSGACTASPCVVTVNGASVGTLTLSVPAGMVVDLGGNSNASSVSSSLTVIDDIAPTILSASITSTDGDADTWYEQTDTVTISIEFSEVVTVSGGSPILSASLTSGGEAVGYGTGSGTDTLNFNFTVLNNDEQCNGVITLNSLNLAGATIQDSIGQDAILTGLPANVSGAKIDAKAPSAAPGAFDAHTATDSYLTRGPTSTWNGASADSCGITQYEYAMGLSAGATDVMAFAGTGSAATTYQAVNGVSGASFSSLVPGTAYYASVRASDAAGNVSATISDPGSTSNRGASRLHIECCC